MMKARILSPEQTELQTQLRRDLRVSFERNTRRVYTQAHAYHSQSKIGSQNWKIIYKPPKRSFTSSRQESPASSKHPSLLYGPSLISPLTPFRAPSLDTVNRTSRNIDLAIHQQSIDVSALSLRIGKLNLEGGSPSSTPSRRERDILRRPLDVTPHVASTTAAALNAEQAAHRLKEALLTVRTQPLLNTQAASAKPAMRVFDTPQKPPDANLGSSGASFGGGIFSSPLALPQLNVSESAGKGASCSPPVGAGRRSTTQKYHAKSVALKSTPTAGTTPKPSFDWGPLPGIKPMTTIASDLRSKT